MRIFLVRHGQSQANAGLCEAIDCDLTDLGRRQSAAAADAIARLGADCVLASPYRRCLATAEFIRSATGASAEFWPAVHEHHHDPFPPGPWPLPDRCELERLWTGFRAPDDMPPGRWATVPEDRDGQWRRIGEAVRQLLGRFRTASGARVVVVTHMAPASVFVQAFCQWANPLNVRVHVDPGSITILETDAAARRHIVRLNWLPDL